MTTLIKALSKRRPQDGTPYNVNLNQRHRKMLADLATLYCLKPSDVVRMAIRDLHKKEFPDAFIPDTPDTPGSD